MPIPRGAERARPTTGLTRPAAGSFPPPAARGGFGGPAVAIFAVALAVRLVHLWQIRRAPFFTVLLGDSRAYDEWAQRLAGGDWIGHEVFYQAPLYPYFLGLLYAIGGRHLLLVRLVQAFVGSAACVLLGLAARRLFSVRAGLAAGLMLALYAPAIFFDGLIQKSVLDVFFVCLALWLIARIITVRLKPDTTETDPAGRRKPDTTETRDRADRRQRTGSVRLQPDLRWFTLGVAIGGLSLTRENAIVFTAVITVWSFWHSRRAAAAFLAGVAIVIGPVAIRNSTVGGGFYVTTSQFGPNFYIGNNPQSDGSYQSLRFGRGAPEYERQDATEIAERALRRKLTPAEVSGYWTDRALDFIAANRGMALLNTHPDYLRNPVTWNVYEGFLREMSLRADYHHALPRDVARWWRARAGAALAGDLEGGIASTIHVRDGRVEFSDRRAASPPDRHASRTAGARSSAGRTA